MQDTASLGRITQFVAGAHLNGVLPAPPYLPLGPVSVVIGAEYRRETNHFREDPLVQEGYTFYNAIGTFHRPSLRGCRRLRRTARASS